MYDVVAIGNALVDTEFTLSDAALDATGLARGNMTFSRYQWSKYAVCRPK